MRSPIDLRALAAMRVVAALAFLAWVLWGLWSGTALVEAGLARSGRFGWAMPILFSFGLLTGGALLFGWRSIFAALLCGMVVMTTHPFGDGGSATTLILVQVLAVVMTLPVGHRWSIDAALALGFAEKRGAALETPGNVSLGSVWMMFVGLAATLVTALRAGDIFAAIVVSLFWSMPLWPTRVWDAATRRLESPRRRAMLIAFDGGCSFCRRMVYVLRAALGIGAIPMAPAQTDPALEEIMKRENSWVVVDAEGGRHLRFVAVIVCVRASPWAWPVAPLLRFPPAHAIGDRLYRVVARNRSRAGRLTSFFGYAPLPEHDTTRTRIRSALIAVGVAVLAFL